MWTKIKKFFYHLFACENAPEFTRYNEPEPRSLYDHAPGVDEEASHPLK